METLGEDLPKEIQRVQYLIGIYEKCPYGFIAAAMMRCDVAKAQRAIDENNIVAMIESMQDLRSYKD